MNGKLVWFGLIKILLIASIATVAIGLVWTNGTALATVMPNVQVQLSTTDQKVVPGQAMSVNIEIISKEDVGSIIFRLKPGAAWRFDSGDLEWRGSLTIGSEVKLQAVLTPLQAKVDKVFAEVEMPDRGATIETFLDLQPEIPLSSMLKCLPNEISIVPAPTPPLGVSPMSAISINIGSTEAIPLAPDCSMTLTGRLIYQVQYPMKPTGEYVGVRYAQVEMWDSDFGVSPDDLMASGTTDANGYFWLTGSANEGDDNTGQGPDIYLVVYAYGRAVEVRPVNGNVCYQAQSDIIQYDAPCGSIVNAGNLGFSNPGAWSIVSTIDKFWEYISAYANPNPQQRIVRWPSPGNSGGDEVNISAGNEWGAKMLGHEWSHGIAFEYFGDPGHDYCNGVCDDSSCGHCPWSAEKPAVVYTEGWNEFANVWMVEYYQLERMCCCSEFLGPAHTEENVEICDPWEPGYDELTLENVEAVWDHTFFDIVDDSPGEDHDNDGLQDNLSVDFGLQWNVMLNYDPPPYWDPIWQKVIDNPHPYRLREFYDGWCLMYPDLKRALWEVMAENHVFMPDLDEPDNNCLSAKLVIPDGAVTWHVLDASFFSIDDEDWYRVDLTGPGLTYRIETPGHPGTPVTDTVLELYASDCQTLLASNDNWGGSLISRIEFLNTGQGSTTYYIKLRGQNQATGVYGLRVIEITPPVTAVSTVPDIPNGCNGYFNTPVTLVLTATDLGSGVRETHYKIDSGSWKDYTGPVTIDKECVHTFFYYSVDNAGNQETPNQKEVKIDLAPPKTTATLSPSSPSGCNGYWDEPVKVFLNATDSCSGFLATHYKIDDGSWQVYTAPFTIDYECEHDIYFKSQDLTCNEEAEQSVHLKLDLIPPAVSYSGNIGIYGILDMVDIVCSASDDCSGILNADCACISGPAYLFQAGKNTFTALAIDNACHTGFGSTSFSVVATYSDLCTLTHQFVWKDGVAKDLCNKLAKASEAEAKGKIDEKAKNLDEYKEKLIIEAGKSLTEEQAGILYKFADALAGTASEPPIVALTVSSNPVKIGQVVILDASGSTPGLPDRIIVKFDWDLDNDGLFDDASGPLVPWVWPSPGTYFVCVTVTDNTGASSLCCVAVDVIANQPPQCMLTVNPLNPWLGQTVTAVAGCIDPEGDLVNCTIDWADGSPVVPGPIASHTYSAYETLGAHNVCAICTDINGNSSACCVTVMVTQPLTRFSVKLAALETKGAINLAKPTEVTQRVNIKVKNESRLYDAVVNVNLYRWRFRTTSAVDHQNSWTLVSVPKGRTISLTPYFYYTYQCDDRPSIKWKAVVILLNGTDSKPQNNAMIKQVNVHGDKKVCP